MTPIPAPSQTEAKPEAKTGTKQFQKTDPSGPPKLDPAWSALGVSFGFQPPPSTKLRLFLLSRPGVGKSTFMMSRPRNLVLSFEKSSEFVSRGMTHHVHISSIIKYRQIMDRLIKEAKSGRPSFDCVSFDCIDDFLKLLDDELCIRYAKRDKAGAITYQLNTITEYGQGGAGMSKLRIAMEDELLALTAIGYSWICASHLTDKTVKKPDGTEYEATRISLYPSTVNSICNQSDFILGITSAITKTSKTYKEKIFDVNNKPILDSQGKPKMKIKTRMITAEKFTLTSDSTTIPMAKRRLPGMSYSMSLPRINGWNVFSKAYQENCERLKKEETV